MVGRFFHSITAREAASPKMLAHARLSCTKYLRGTRNCLPAVSQSTYAQKKFAKAEDINSIAEVKQARQFQEQLRTGTCASLPPLRYKVQPSSLARAASKDEVLCAIAAGYTTFALHVEARIASAIQEGYYTIGPCGEELMSAVGLVLKSDDAVALHYRHLGTQIARHAKAAHNPDVLTLESFMAILDSLVLDRARGYCVSAEDPVTGGAHCALGGGENDFIVTSTLASQATPAVGRAIAPAMAKHFGVSSTLPRKAISFVSVGDGSVNNAHFLSGLNIANYITHRGFKCPVLFTVSDNGMCISLKNYGWLNRFRKTVGMPIVECDGRDLADIFTASRRAAQLVRSSGKPAMLICSNLRRRFGHAATDRQAAYLPEEEISRMESTNPLEWASAQAVEEGLVTYSELAQLFERITKSVESAFEKASMEPKLESLGRQELIDRLRPSTSERMPQIVPSAIRNRNLKGRKGVMRKHMTGAIEESLKQHADLVYLGEDVEHGGYYLVTDGLARKYPGRVRDLPPDETSLLGLGLGLSQGGLLPVVEIPYAKYLDCGADIFTEIVALNWLNKKDSQKGMVIRLQGFDLGVFGGNYHTHNTIPLPPGLDVMVFSNGTDWVKGWRHAVKKARAGHIVMVVDSTALLNRRHINQDELDGGMLLPYPGDLSEELTFDSVLRHGESSSSSAPDDVTIVTYGNGVLHSLNVQKELQPVMRIGVVEVPCVSTMSPALAEALQNSKTVLFADVCKSNQAPLQQFVTELKSQGVIGKDRDWEFIGACPTYNPLGSTVTFLSEQDISDVCQKLSPNASP